MQDHVYKMIELAGSSETSIEDAIQNAITRAAKTLHDLRWFQFRGDAAWTDSPAVACAATSELWRRDSHTGSAFVTVSTAASIMGPFFTLPRCSLRMR